MTKLNLTTLQSRFKKALESGTSVKALKAMGVRENARFSIKQRFNVYQYAVMSRLKEAIAEDFPRVGELLGEKTFDKLLSQFLQVHPSTSSSLSEISASLPKFFKLYSLKKYPYLPDLAQFEWLKILSEHHPEVNFEFQPLTALTEELFMSARLKLDSSVHLFRSSWAVHQDEVTAREVYLVVYSNKGEFKCEELSKFEFQIIKKIKSGMNLQDIVLNLEKSEKDTSEVSTLFSQWARKGIIIGFTEDQNG